ncbi:hypothetical protein AB835_00215 [Candidatus Endobugula sertula]|uniref:Uncharacterized protein n=1 Tax=Candidatus Endobugula sertula TaxID=62101 RepID=A0A1D2QU61_9GAMM|nr:hypothetical protein AB835_00215 [Candidatus Endobugula sertula]
MNNDHKQPDGFFYQPNTIRWILRAFYTSCIVLVIVDLVVHRHIITSLEKIPAFYALYGFVACVILVLIASQMRKVLMRDEDYYSRHEETMESQTAEGADDE